MRPIWKVSSSWKRWSNAVSRSLDGMLYRCANVAWTWRMRWPVQMGTLGLDSVDDEEESDERC